MLHLVGRGFWDIARLVVVKGLARATTLDYLRHGDKGRMGQFI